MAGRGRGRGRGRGIKQENEVPMREPDPELIKSLVSQHGSANIDTNGQQQQQSIATPSADTLAATEKTPQTVSELKEALKSGPMVQGLNPHSKEFTPTTTSTADPSRGTALNPNSAEFVPSPGPTKHVPTQPSPSSALNPRTPGFVPGSLNPSATNFIPKESLPLSMQNGELEPFEGGGRQAGEDGGVALLEAVDIMKGFERVHPDDTSCEPLLMAGAEMLVKATVYPGSYDRHLFNLNAAIEPRPSNKSLANLAEMIVHWGILEPALRYTACKMCQELCAKLDGYHSFVLERLHAWYKKRHTEEPTTEEERCDFISCALFFAELFARIKLGYGDPIRPLSTAVFHFLERLLCLKHDDTIIGACNIMKLTGSLLDICEEKASTKKMDELIEKLKELIKDKTVSSKSTNVIMRVIELQSKKWTETLSQTQQPPSRLNTEAPEFIPSNEVQLVLQQPVRNAEEWNEYIGGEEPLEQDETDGFVVDDYEGLDPEIEQDMEAFIDEIEQHLLLQDFDPELLVHQEQVEEDK